MRTVAFLLILAGVFAAPRAAFGARRRAPAAR
jgi:hypothetical protein